MLFDFDVQKAANAVKDMAKIMNCDYKTAWDDYTHDLIKESIKWEDVYELIKDGEYQNPNR